MEIMYVVYQDNQGFKLMEIGIANSNKKTVLFVQVNIIMIVKAMYVPKMQMEFMFAVLVRNLNLALI